MDNLKNLMNDILKIEKALGDNSWAELSKLVTDSVEEESHGTDKYKQMAELAINSREVPESTRKSLYALFNSMSRDEHKHLEMLKQVEEMINSTKTETKKKVNKADNTDMKSQQKFDIVKINDDKQIAFGFCVFSKDSKGNTVVDLQGDAITPEELEKMAYGYMLNGRDVGQLHMTSGEGCVVESMVFTEDKMKAIGIKGDVPVAWWVGLKINNPDAWALVKSGKYKAFSIEGIAERVDKDE